MPKTPLAVAVTLLVAVSLSACSGSTATPSKKILVGDLVSRTGDSADVNYNNGLSLAHDQFNAALVQAKYKDLQIDMPSFDSQSTAAAAVSAALNARDAGVKAVILDSTRVVQAVTRLDYDSDTTNDIKLPAVCGSCTSEDLNNPNYTSAKLADGGLGDQVLQEGNRNTQGWLFTGQMSTKLQAKIMADLVWAAGDVNTDGKIKVGGIHSNDAFGTSTLNTVQTNLAVHDAGIIFEKLSYDTAQASDKIAWAELIEKMKDDKTEQGVQRTNCPGPSYICVSTGAPVTDVVPDISVSISSPGWAAAQVLERRKQAVNIRTIFSQSARTGAVIQVIGQSVAEEMNLEGTSHMLVETGQAGDTFSKDYLDTFGVKPGFRSSTYYDNVVVIMLAISIAVKDLADPTTVTPEQIKAALPKTSDAAGTKIYTGVSEIVKALNLIKEGKAINYEGASGPMDYSADQTVRNKLAHWKFSSGDFQDIAIFDCPTSDACPKL